MKKYIIIFSIMAIAATGMILAQNPDDNQLQITDSMHLKLLQVQKDKLQKQIAKEESLRNRCIPGVAPATLESINDRQDSLCLALRSQLTDIGLEIEELQAAQEQPSTLPAAVIDYLHNTNKETE